MFKRLVLVTVSTLLIEFPVTASERTEVIRVDIGQEHCRKIPALNCENYQGQIGYYVVDAETKKDIQEVFFLAYNPWNDTPENSTPLDTQIDLMRKAIPGLESLTATYCDLAGVSKQFDRKMILGKLLVHFTALGSLRPQNQTITVDGRGTHSLKIAVKSGEMFEIRAK